MLLIFIFNLIGLEIDRAHVSVSAVEFLETVSMWVSNWMEKTQPKCGQHLDGRQEKIETEGGRCSVGQTCLSPSWLPLRWAVLLCHTLSDMVICLPGKERRLQSAFESMVQWVSFRWLAFSYLSQQKNILKICEHIGYLCSSCTSVSTSPSIIYQNDALSYIVGQTKVICIY